ncbi:MAG: response regulator transcription factor [Elusimicrobia bacterium]|nr:response regulator transcription factor [Elusimicrobiota bacterium]
MAELATKPKKIRVLVCDDQTLFREGLIDVLGGERDIEVIGQASNGGEAISMARKLQPDVVLMDIRLPEMDGISATRVIRKDIPKANVVILSSYEDEAHVLEAIQAGANGYLSKMLPAKELVNAIRTFTQEGVLIPQPIMGKLMDGIRKISAAQLEASLINLTKTELLILSMVGRGASNDEIAKKLTSSVKTVKNHLNRTFQKLNVRNRTEAVLKGIDLGLITPETEDRNPK